MSSLSVAFKSAYDTEFPAVFLGEPVENIRAAADPFPMLDNAAPAAEPVSDDEPATVPDESAPAPVIETEPGDEYEPAGLIPAGWAVV